MAASRSDDDEVIIKKYANRRLYDTESSAYITLERLAQMVRQKKHFKVIDAKSGDDITRTVLAQIIMDEESRGSNMLPVNFLRQLISMYGDSIQSVVPHYLEASLEDSDEDDDEDEPRVAPIPLGHIVRYERDRVHPQSLPLEAVDLLRKVIDGKTSEVVDRALSDLLGL